MKKTLALFALSAFLLLAGPNPARAQGGFESVTGDALAKAVPDHFDLSGVHVPVLKQNAVLLRNAKGASVMVGLLETSGSGPRIRQKYSGFLTTETKITVCAISVNPGSYGFGLSPARPPEEEGTFSLYTRGGDEVGECPTRRDARIADPNPVSVVMGKGGTAKIALFKYTVDLK